MRLPRATPAIVLSAAAVTAVPACNLVGPVAAIVHGPEKIQAQYTLEKNRAAVVFVDDRGNRMPRRSLRLTTAQEAEKLILKKGVVTDVISGQSALAASAADRGGRLLSIAEIGRAVGAQQVIYVSVEAFALSTDGSTYDPVATLRVKVIDAVNDKRLWPEDRAGYELNVRVPVRARAMPEGGAARARAEDDLAAQAGQAVAELFYKHEKPSGATPR